MEAGAISLPLAMVPIFLVKGVKRVTFIGTAGDPMQTPPTNELEVSAPSLVISDIKVTTDWPHGSLLSMGLVLLRYGNNKTCGCIIDMQRTHQCVLLRVKASFQGL